MRDVLHSSDVVNLYFKTVENIDSVSGNVFNIGGGVINSLSLLELFNLLEEILQINLKYKKLPFRESDQLVFIADNRKAENLIGWKAKTNTIDGINHSISWAKNLLNK